MKTTTNMIAFWGRGVLTLVLGFLACGVQGQFLRMPQAGEVFRDYSRANLQDNSRVTSPTATHPGALAFLPNPILNLTVADLQGAIRAELVMDFWIGHVGTAGKAIPLQRQ